VVSRSGRVACPGLMVVELVVVIFLVILNGFFAMSELAIVSSRRIRLQSMADSGNRGASVALALAQDPGRFLSTVQVGITLVGVLAGAFGGATLSDPLRGFLDDIPLVAAWADQIAFTLVVVAITYLSLIVGELVPKRIALGFAEPIAARVARPMQMLSAFGAPVVWILQRSTELVMRLLRIPAPAAQTVTEEEVKTLIAEGTEAGVFESDEKHMIEGVMRLADRSVRSIMTPRPEVVWLDPDDPPERLSTEIRESGRSRFPVMRAGDELVGVVQTKDVLDRAMAGGAFDVLGCIRRPLVVHDGTSVFKLMEMFRGADLHMAVVVDEYGSFEGVVTPTDVLEAIVGDIQDGTQGPIEDPIVRRPDGSWLIDGLTSVDDVERALALRGIRSPDGDYETVAGFVLWQFGHVPRVGETVVWNDLCFEVVDLDGNRIDKLLVRPAYPAQEGNPT
jgi:putative hemolysin